MHHAAITPDFITSFEPATGGELCCAPVCDVDAAVAQARAAWPQWALQNPSARMEMVRRWSQDLARMGGDLGETLARETGMPLWEAQAECDAALMRVETLIRAHAERCAQRRHDNGRAGAIAVRHKPHGVMVAITPFSQPLLTAMGQIVPALIAGNTVIHKPSDKSIAIGQILAEAAARVGLAPGVFQSLVGGAQSGHALAMHDGVDGVLFAGSTPVGVALARKLAARPDRMLRMELGGNNPLVVWDTPLIEDAATLIVQSAFTSAGQRRSCARRLIVREDMAESVIGAVKRLTDRIILGAPLDDPAPFMGPVADMAAADGLTQSFIWLMTHGGRPIRHLGRPRPDLPFLSPGIIDVTDMAERPDLELFGPLLQVIRVRDFDEAIAAANDTHYGMVAGLIGGNPAHYNQFWAQIRAGLIHWNRPTISDLPGVPQGGLGLSGNLHPGGTYAADSCAYPVSSAEVEQPRAALGTGFRPQDQA